MSQEMAERSTPELSRNKELFYYLEALEDAIPEVTQFGYAIMDSLVPAHVLDGLVEDVKFHWYPRDENRSGNGGRRPVLVTPETGFEKVFLSARHRQNITDLAENVGGFVRNAGEKLGIDSLSNWSSNHATVHRYEADLDRGKVGQKYRNSDPEDFSGVIIDIRLVPAAITTWEPGVDGKLHANEHNLQVGSTTIFAGKDLCNELGIDQVERATSTDESGFSITLMNEPKRSGIGLKSFIKRFQK